MSQSHLTFNRVFQSRVCCGMAELLVEVTRPLLDILFCCKFCVCLWITCTLHKFYSDRGCKRPRQLVDDEFVFVVDTCTTRPVLSSWGWVMNRCGLGNCIVSDFSIKMESKDQGNMLNWRKSIKEGRVCQCSRKSSLLPASRSRLLFYMASNFLSSSPSHKSIFLSSSHSLLAN
jgi:hypothetical protein